ncbi:uncharacterized protein LOC143055874 isoform X2 [Mytilus galloprovincialis]|uniref:uncharacterized protein LOC143055874 isoform X2 n=1 Tax=Mytilus galloprovincialis TaxID=29158 RepID=UPI003F7C3C66
MDKDDEDSIDSILTEIETSLQSTYPETGENENQVFSAYYEDQRTVGYGRKDDASFMLTYNNPFDPRLTFHGLGEHVHQPDVKDEKYKAELTENVFLALDQPSQLMDKYLNGYRAYVRGLSDSPGSGDWADRSIECKRLYERISSNAVKSIWSENTEKPKPPTNSNVVNKSDHASTAETNQQCRPKTTKTRLTMRQKKDSDSFTRNVAYADTGMPGKFEGCVPTEDKNKSQSNAEHNGDKKRTNLPSRFGIKDTIYKHPKTDKPIVQDQREMNGMPDGTENKIETHNQTTKVSSHGPTIINDNYNSQQNIKNNTNSIYTRVQNPILPNPYPRNNEFQGIQPKPLDQSSWSHQSYRPNHYTTNYPTSQLWTDQNQPRQQQLWHDQNLYQQLSNNHNTSTKIQPPPGFNQQLVRPPGLVNQRTNFQPDLQPTGMYQNIQDVSDPQSFLYNLQQFVQQPPTQIQNPISRYQYYPGQLKPQCTYNGNWNANNNNTDDEEISNTVHYSSTETMGEEIYRKEHRDRPRCKTRNIRANLIRIYPSKNK